MKFRKSRIGRSFGAVGLILITGGLIAAVEKYESLGYSASPPDQLTDLERRIDQLEKVGPFEVVDSKGLPIFRVESSTDMSSFYTNKATVYNSDGAPVAVMGADNGGGFLRVISADLQRSSAVGGGKTWGLHFDEMAPLSDTTSQAKKDVTRLELGRNESGNYVLNIFGTSLNRIAGIGESNSGGGALVVGDSKVSNRASMFVGRDNKGFIGIVNKDGISVVSFGEAVNNTGGELALGAANGDPRVLMGTADNRYGVVMALPQGLPYVPRSGLPGSYLLGCAGGGSCVR